MTGQYRAMIAMLMLTCWCAPAFASPPQAKQHRSQGATVNVNGMTMYYETYGEGEPLLLVHGFSSSGRETWTPFVDLLSARHRLVIPDLRGHGRSTNPADTFTHRQCALDMFALLDHLKIRDFKAMGISSGGMTLLHMATQQPNRVQAMVLIGAVHDRRKQARASLAERDLLAADGPWGGYRRLCKVHSRGDEQIHKLCRHFIAVQDNPRDMEFSHEDLGRIKSRVLIMHGDRDMFFPVEVAVEMYKSIPDAALWIVPNAGHVPVFSKRVSFVGTTLGFLDRSWRTVDVSFSDPDHPWGARDDAPDEIEKNDLQF